MKKIIIGIFLAWHCVAQVAVDTPYSTPPAGLLPIGDGSVWQGGYITGGTGISVSYSGGNILVTATGGGGGSGSVTSVAASVPSFLSISGSPITTNGTLAVSYSGTALPVANGGSGATTLTGYLIGNGTSPFTASATIPATALSGTIPDARFPATLPAASGANLTSLSATALSSGTVAPARLGSGSGGSTKFLREDSTFQTIGGGGDALVANPLSQFASTTSAQLLGVLSDPTGTGSAMFSASPTTTGTLTGEVGLFDTLRLAIPFGDVAEFPQDVPDYEFLENHVAPVIAATLTNLLEAAISPISQFGFVNSDADDDLEGLWAWCPALTDVDNGTTIRRPFSIVSDATEGRWVKVQMSGGGSGDAVTSANLDQFADVTQTATKTLAITESTTLAGGNHSGTNTGDQTSVSGNAGTATALATGRTLGITGDLVWTSPSFDGSGNVTAAGTLATVNSSVGTYGNSSYIPSFTVNAKGLITGVTTNAVAGGGGGGNVYSPYSVTQFAMPVFADATGTNLVETPWIVNTNTGDVTGIGDITAVNLILSSPVPVASGGTGVTNLGTGIVAALQVNTGTSGSPMILGGNGDIRYKFVPAGFFVDAGGSAVPTGKVKGYTTARQAGTITGWNIAVDTGTCTVKVWKIATGTAVPTISNVINTSGVSISSGTYVRSTTTSDFTTTAVAENDILAYDITAVSGATEITFGLQITAQ